MKRLVKLSFLIFTFSLIGSFTTFANDGNCTKCTTTPGSNTGKCKKKVDGTGHSCVADPCGNWMNPCGCDGEVTVNCSDISSS